jgi:hypothetical protein
LQPLAQLSPLLVVLDERAFDRGQRRRALRGAVGLDRLDARVGPARLVRQLRRAAHPDRHARARLADHRLAEDELEHAHPARRRQLDDDLVARELVAQVLAQRPRLGRGAEQLQRRERAGEQLDRGAALLADRRPRFVLSDVAPARLWREIADVPSYRAITRIAKPRRSSLRIFRTGVGLRLPDPVLARNLLRLWRVPESKRIA